MSARPVVRPARPEDAARVGAFLSAHMNPRIPAEVFARILDYPWQAPRPHLGMLAELGGEVVGYHGCVWSRRGAARFGSFSSLYVRRDMRGEDLGGRMMRAITAEAGPTLTVFHPSRRVHDLLEACGFRDLDTHRRVWAPGEGDPRAGVEAVRDPAAIRAAAGAEGLRLLADHAGLPAVPVLLSGRGDAALSFWLRQDRGASGRVWELIAGPEPERLAALIEGAAAALTAEGERVLVDERFLGGADLGRREALAHRRMWRPGEATPARWRVDHLYTETLLLGLKLG